MKLLFDENVDRRLTKPLSEAGHDVKVAEKSVSNSALFSLAKKAERILLTNDTDFLDRSYTSDKRMGIIVFRVFPDALENQKEALLRLFDKYGENDFFGKTVELGRESEIFTT